MSQQHQIHYKHPKIAKNTANKLPEAFLQSKTTVIIPKKVQQQKMRQQVTERQRTQRKQQRQKDHVKQGIQNNNNRDKQKQRKQKNRESRNPFLPIRKFKQQMQKFAQQRKAVEEMLSQARFEHLRLSQNSIGFNSISKQQPLQKMKYEQFITLTLVSKKQTMLLKKILHVPTLKVYYLRESLINLSIDKAELTEWMENCNEGGKKIIEMFWNIPQGYYSLVYEYEEGILMQTLLDTLNTLPLPIIQSIAISHFTANVGIYNSQLILNVGNDAVTPRIYYMPIYEQTPPLIRSQKLQSILSQQIDEQDIDRKILWRLGIILMASFLGEEFLRSDLLHLEHENLKSCCLFHSIIQLDSSLCKLYLEENQLFEQSQLFISFLCHLLSLKKSPTFAKSLSDVKVKKHKFLTQQYESLLTLKQLFHAVSMIDLQDCDYALGQFGSEFKLHKTMDVIGLSLQNVDLQKFKPIDFSTNNKNIQFIAQQLGMKNEVQKVATCLKQVYQKEGN